MADDNRHSRPPAPPDERSVARKFGIRELNYPDGDQVRALSAFIGEAVESGRCGVVPKTAVVMTLEFLQATITRQHITKHPRMSPAEFDALQNPYYTAARIVARLQRARKDGSRDNLYQSTWISLARFTDLLRQLQDPACPWLRSRSLPADVRQSMLALREFLGAWSEQKRKGRAV